MSVLLFPNSNSNRKWHLNTHASFLIGVYLYIFLFFYLYFFNINVFNWRLITLQYCGGFAIHQHESTMGVNMFPILNPPPPPSPYHPSGSSQCSSPKHPVSCIEPGLAIRFIYDVSMPFSQIITPSPSPTEPKRLFYTSVSLALSHTGLSLPSF